MKPNFKNGTKFSKSHMSVEIGRTKIKPVYLGQAILDLSKLIMYEFHYDYIVPKYGEKLRLCYMDTDSFVYHINRHHIYKDIARDAEKRLNISEYSK